MDTMRELVAAELRAMLARKRVSAAALARRLGWSQTYMARRVDGRAEPTLTELQQIAEALGVEIADLLPASARRGTMTPSVLQARRSRQIGVRTIVPSADRHLTGRVASPNGRVAIQAVDEVATISRRTGRLKATP